MTKQFFKSTGAILTGLIGVVVLSIGTDYILEKTGVFPTYPNPLTVGWMVLLATFYRTVYAIAGSFMAVFLAPHRPMRHALILGFIGLGLNIIGVLVIWGLEKTVNFLRSPGRLQPGIPWHWSLWPYPVHGWVDGYKTSG